MPHNDPYDPDLEYLSEPEILPAGKLVDVLMHELGHYIVFKDVVHLPGIIFMDRKYEEYNLYFGEVGPLLSEESRKQICLGSLVVHDLYGCPLYGCKDDLKSAIYSHIRSLNSSSEWGTFSELLKKDINSQAVWARTQDAYYQALEIIVEFDQEENLESLSKHLLSRVNDTCHTHVFLEEEDTEFARSIQYPIEPELITF